MMFLNPKWPWALKGSPLLSKVVPYFLSPGQIQHSVENQLPHHIPEVEQKTIHVAPYLKSGYTRCLKKLMHTMNDGGNTSNWIAATYV